MRKLLPVFLLLVLIACKKDDQPKSTDPNVDLKAVYGRWKLISYSGGFTGGNYTPAGLTILELRKDGIYKRTVNSEVKAEGKFNIAKGKSIFGVDSMYQIDYKNPFKQAIFKAKADTLSLGDEIYDGYGYTYIRTN
jgi:hypothetical protein